MRDAGYLRDAIVAALSFEVPRKVALLRDAWDLDQVEFPDVDKITSGEPTDNSLSSMGQTWITVINPRLQKTDQVDIDPYGLPVYMSRYACQIYVWVKGEDWESSIRGRDRLAVAVRLSLLEWPNLKPGVYGDTGFRVHRNTYLEEFGEPQRMHSSAGAQRVWAPALCSIDIDTEESLRDGSTRDPIGVVNTTITTATAVGPETPFPETETP